MDCVLTKNDTKFRNSNFELLRIVAMILIIVFHFVYHSSAIHSSSFCTNKVLAYLVGSWGIVGVHCFFFISAWFLQRKENSFNALKLYTVFFQVIFYSVLVLTVGDLTGILSIDFKTVTSTLIFWYINAYCIMCLLSPFLNRFINACDRVYLGRLVFVLTVLFPLISFFYPLNSMSNTGLVIYDYLLIAYLKKSGNNFFERNRYVGLLVTFVVAVFGEFLILYFLRSTDLIDKFTGRFSIFQMLIAVFIFYIFKNFSFQNKVVNLLAKNTLAVYILHEGVLSDFLRNRVLHLDTAYTESYYVLYLLISAMLVYLVLTFGDFFRHYIYVGVTNRLYPYINRVNSKINGWVNG